ncbi:VTT domain-containing protein [Granulicella sp. S190]|uniref:VTT domain-containing protein n=1 Tax=Granulicella sp. S190 TaxID=1747226 RepID=UPI00131D45F6|nr:VTT domain-containing protein [Granulicella sp. S190]
MGLMDVIANHGYAVTAMVMFLAALGLPLPMSITLLAAGAASQHGLKLTMVAAVAWIAAVLGDTLLYFGGRYTGWWLLSGMCRVSLNPEQCIFSSAGYFYRRGQKTLLFAKFIPGLGAMAAPLAGALNMKLWRFLRLDALGALIYCSLWLAIGFRFSGFLREIAEWIGRVSHAALFLLLLLGFGYALALIVFTMRAQRYRGIDRITADNLYERLQSITPDRLVIIADVRSHGYYDPGMQRIKNSIRVEPHRLKEELIALREFMVPECEIYLYCSCLRDTTSVRVAHMLMQENCHTQVITGGMKAWVKAGGDVEMVPATDMQHLPRFD